MVTKVNGMAPVSNDAEEQIGYSEPYIVRTRIKGTAALLFHAWSNDAVAAKGAAAKGSKAKKTDDVKSYVYRTPENEIAIPGEYLRMAIVMAAKFRQDPRSPRKSAMDLFKAGIVSLTELASLGAKDWDYLDSRRVQIQRSAITRMRPAFFPGWEAEFELQIQLPEYIPPEMVHDVVSQAGKLIGVGDFRPTFGRFQVIQFEAV